MPPGKRGSPHTPPGARAEIAELIPPRIALFPQHGPDLGVRLARATERVFASHRGALVVIGTDAPEVGPVHVREAELALAAGHGACLIPALDGGYALIALAGPVPEAFALPPDAWGGPDVLERTLLALQAARCSWALLEPVRDLDTRADAKWVAADPRCPPSIRQILRREVSA